MKLFEHEDNSLHEPQHTTIRHSWKVLQLGRFTLLEVYYLHHVYDDHMNGIAFILTIVRSSALLGLDVQTHQRDLGVYLFNWSNHTELKEWEL